MVNEEQRKYEAFHVSFTIILYSFYSKSPLFGGLNMKINMSSMDLNYILIPLGVSWLYDLGQMIQLSCLHGLTFSVGAVGVLIRGCM